MSPLRLTGVPATVAPGAAVAVKVEELHQPVFPATETTVVPATGATVHAGGATATAGADGVAQLTLAGPVPVAVQATKAGHTRSATEATCVTTGADGACGTQPPPARRRPARGRPRHDRAGRVDLRAEAGHRVLPPQGAARAARHGHGRSVRPQVGPAEHRPQARRSAAGRSTAARERFERHRCGGSPSFRIGDRADWSYLLPKRLPKGRYTIRVVAIDKAGNDAATETVIRVR